MAGRSFEEAAQVLQAVQEWTEGPVGGVCCETASFRQGGFECTDGDRLRLGHTRRFPFMPGTFSGRSRTTHQETGMNEKSVGGFGV